MGSRHDRKTPGSDGSEARLAFGMPVWPQCFCAGALNITFTSGGICRRVERTRLLVTSVKAIMADVDATPRLKKHNGCAVAERGT